MGTAAVAIVELEDGTRFLRIEDLDTLSGPDLRVYLSKASASSPQDALDDAFVDLGGLRRRSGVIRTRSGASKVLWARN